MTKLQTTPAALLLAAFSLSRLCGQPSQAAPSGQARPASATPLSFDVVSIKPAPPGTQPSVPAFMRDRGARILGIQRMAAPVWVLIGYAYNMDKSEGLQTIRKQPDWVKNRIYTVTFRAKDDPTRQEVREMMRTMLSERFDLQIHEFSRQGAINRLVLSKPGVLGPNINAHPEAAPCSTGDGASLGNTLDPTNPTAGHCGFTFYQLPGMISHVGWTDTTMAEAARGLAGLGPNGLETRPLVDATGLIGKYDLTLEYRPLSGSPLMEAEEDDSDKPTLIQALQQQLGMRVESGTGPIRMVVIDRISQPTPD